MDALRPGKAAAAASESGPSAQSLAPQLAAPWCLPCICSGVLTARWWVGLEPVLAPLAPVKVVSAVICNF